MPGLSVTMTLDPADRTTSAGQFVKRSGRNLMLAGKVFRFGGTNMYWLGLDDNEPVSPTYPSHSIINSGFTAAVAMGAKVVRAHTLGVSVGDALSLEPTLGNFNDNAFESIDYAISRAAANNIKLIIPLTDQWHWYHGGKHTFTNWRGYTDLPGKTAANDNTQKALEANFYTDTTVIADFKAYISYLLNHVNQYTGIALKNDPTILAWESGNELWDATTSWTQNIAQYVKNTLQAKQLFSDGSAATGNSVSNAAINVPEVDIIGGHFYPMDVSWMVSDAAIANTNKKAYVVGEYDWTDLTTLTTSMLPTVETNFNIAGDITWVTLPNKDDGTPMPHGDTENLYYPTTTSDMGTAATALRNHAALMTR